MIFFDDHRVTPFLKEADLNRLLPRCLAAQRALIQGTGEGAEWLGWRKMLQEPNDALLEKIQTVADRVRSLADVIVIVGIGGSYLGARALLSASSPYFSGPCPQDFGEQNTEGHDSGSRDSEGQNSETPNSEARANGTARKAAPEIVFAGHQMSGSYMEDLLAHLEGRSVYVIAISKSGTTLEPAIAFRFLKQWIYARFDDAKERIVVVTDSKKGALFSLASRAGYERFVIPDDIGGRFSVLSPVGLLPAACGGLDIQTLFYGAVAELNETAENEENAAARYALLRSALLSTGYETEVLASFEPKLSYFAAWFQQLFGESEGKNNTGVFPTVAAYSTDLHSLGQYLQDGRRTLFETFLLVDSAVGPTIPSDADNEDGLNYIAGRSLDSVNHNAFEATSRAHEAGGVPNMTIRMDCLSEENLGRCIYFFEHAVAIGGYLLGVNPFDQPGVEAYKKEMFAGLSRPDERR